MGSESGILGEGEVMLELKPQFGLEEAQEACHAMRLTPVKLGDHLVVLNSDYDVMLSGEPYFALMLVFHLESGKFVARVWNQTVTRGKAVTLQQFVEACRSFFSNGRPCLGILQHVGFPIFYIYFTGS